MKNLFLAWTRFFEDKFLYALDAPIVRLLDFLVIGECMYCAVIRALLIGVGLGLFNVFGLILVAGAVALRLAEKKYIEGEM